MKILLVTEGLGSGGAERQFVGLATMLKQKGIDVSVLTYVQRDFYKDVLDKEGISNEVYISALNKYTRIYKLTKKANAYNADIVISFLPGSNIALALGKKLGLLQSKLVVSERNFTTIWDLATKIKFKILSYADMLVTNSYAEANNIKCNTQCFREGQVKTIHNFINSEYFVPKSIDRDKTVKHILCVARLRDYKNVVGFIECVHVLRNKGYNFKVSWYGHDYQDEYSFYVRSLLDKFSLHDIFKIHEPTKNIKDVYNAADALCLPSFKEGYPNVIVEAMACGLPILCSRICDNPTIVTDYQNGFLFNPNNIDDIVSAVESFFKMSDNERLQMGEINRKKVIANNSKEYFINSYLDLINQLS